MGEFYKEIERYLSKARKNINSDSTRKYALKIIWTALKHIFDISDFLKTRKNGKQIVLLAVLGGGIGDAVFAIRFFYEIKRKFGELLSVNFQVNSNLNAESLLYGHSFFDKLVTQSKKGSYDCIIQLVRYPEVKYINSEKIKRISPNFFKICEDIIRFTKKNYIFFVDEPNHDFLGSLYARCLGLRRENQMDVLQEMSVLSSDFSLFYNKASEKILDKYNLETNNFITVQRGVGDYNNKYPVSLTRLWSVENYNILIRMLKESNNTKHLKIIQIGSKFSASLEDVDFDLRGKTTFEELKVLLSHAKFHIDGEAGMVHMRHFLCKKPSVVIFGPTDEKFFGYVENINISARPDSCPVACDWLVPYWREKCIVTGTGDAACQRNISPETVMEKIISYKGSKEIIPIFPVKNDIEV